jgi:hypothetical protein
MTATPSQICWVSDLGGYHPDGPLALEADDPSGRSPHPGHRYRLSLTRADRRSERRPEKLVIRCIVAKGALGATG